MPKETSGKNVGHMKHSPAATGIKKNIRNSNRKKRSSKRKTGSVEAAAGKSSETVAKLMQQPRKQSQKGARVSRRKSHLKAHNTPKKHLMKASPDGKRKNKAVSGPRRKSAKK